jgi:type I restriction-modification system DNA methylase subunit
MATHNRIVSVLWGIADDVLRDLFEWGQYPDVILPSTACRVVDPLFLDQTEFYEQFKNNALFRKFVRDLVKQLINKNPDDSP